MLFPDHPKPLLGVTKKNVQAPPANVKLTVVILPTLFVTATLVTASVCWVWDESAISRRPVVNEFEISRDVSVPML